MIPALLLLLSLLTFASASTSLKNDATPQKARRDIKTSVSSSWPTDVFSPLCETFAYLDKSLKDVESSAKDSKNRFRDNANSWKYLDALTGDGGVAALDDWLANNDNSGGTGEHSEWNIQNSTALAIASVHTTNSLDVNLLPLSLALRAYAPTCEMHRTLARDAALSYGLYDGQQKVVPEAFAIISRVRYEVDNEVIGTEVLVDLNELDAALERLETLSDAETSTGTGSVSSGQSPLLFPLPDETYHPKVVTPHIDYEDPRWRQMMEEFYAVKDETVAILYGQFGTSTFAKFYNALKKRNVKFVVRHMGYLSYEEDQSNTHDDNATKRAIPTMLQGYGVRLDIRNVEYKAFDDEPSSDDKNDEVIDWNEVVHDPEEPARDEYIAGINLHKLLNRLDNDSATTTPLPTDLQTLQTTLLRSHPAQSSAESIVPPAWKRRSLSLQAATVIASSSDPLKALSGISQNLPSVAHSLSSVTVDESFQSQALEATTLSEQIGAFSSKLDASFGFYVNSHEVNIERPSFNIFQLLDVIRSEDGKLRELEKDVRPMLEGNVETLVGEGRGKGIVFKVLKDIRRGMDMGLERLIEFGKGKKEDGIDESSQDSSGMDEPVENDKMYRIDVGRGGKKAIAYLNNLEKDPGYQSWPRVEEMMMRMQFGQGMAARRNLFTLLIVIDPVSGTGVHPAINIMTQLVNGQFPVRIGLLVVSQDDVVNKKASEPRAFDKGNRQLHSSDALAIIRHVGKKYGSMAAINALASVFQPHDGTIPTVNEYIDSYISLLSQMGVVRADKQSFIRQEIQLLLTFPETDDDRYSEAIDFATKKLLKPGENIV